MGGLTEEETLKSWTVTLIVMGVAALPLIGILAWLLPLTG
jgi:H+/gluconate symporter-like permease